jgi:hypothetical protein
MISPEGVVQLLLTSWETERSFEWNDDETMTALNSVIYQGLSTPAWKIRGSRESAWHSFMVNVTVTKCTLLQRYVGLCVNVAVLLRCD